MQECGTREAWGRKHLTEEEGRGREGGRRGKERGRGMEGEGADRREGEGGKEQEGGMERGEVGQGGHGPVSGLLRNKRDEHGGDHHLCLPRRCRLGGLT